VTATKASRRAVEPATRTPTLEQHAQSARTCKVIIATVASGLVHRLDAVAERVISRTVRRLSLELVLSGYSLQKKA